MSNSFAIPWTVACQAPLSMGFPRQEYWSGLPFPSPGVLPDPGLLHCRRILCHWATRVVPGRSVLDKWSFSFSLLLGKLKFQEEGFTCDTGRARCLPDSQLWCSICPLHPSSMAPLPPPSCPLPTGDFWAGGSLEPSEPSLRTSAPLRRPASVSTTEERVPSGTAEAGGAQPAFKGSACMSLIRKSRQVFSGKQWVLTVENYRGRKRWKELLFTHIVPSTPSPEWVSKEAVASFVLGEWGRVEAVLGHTHWQVQTRALSSPALAVRKPRQSSLNHSVHCRSVWPYLEQVHAHHFPNSICSPYLYVIFW